MPAPKARHWMAEPVPDSLYARIRATVRCIPPGRVATYADVAQWTGHCGARQVGYALSALAPDTTVPWHRVVNARGEISLRAGDEDRPLQRERLREEGVHFDARGRLDLASVRWPGPEADAIPST